MYFPASRSCIIASFVSWEKYRKNRPNRIIYVDSEVRRTSYYLTEDGYNLLLSTLEIENNMKITIHEMIFRMHLVRFR